MVGRCGNSSWSCKDVVSEAQHKQALCKADLSVASLLFFRPNLLFSSSCSYDSGTCWRKSQFRDTPVMKIATGICPETNCNAKLASAVCTTTPLFVNLLVLFVAHKQICCYGTQDTITCILIQC